MTEYVKELARPFFLTWETFPQRRPLALLAGVLMTQHKAGVGPPFGWVALLLGISKPSCTSADINAQSSGQTGSICSPTI